MDRRLSQQHNWDEQKSSHTKSVSITPLFPLIGERGREGEGVRLSSEAKKGCTERIWYQRQVFAEKDSALTDKSWRKCFARTSVDQLLQETPMSLRLQQSNESLSPPLPLPPSPPHFQARSIPFAHWQDFHDQSRLQSPPALHENLPEYLVLLRPGRGVQSFRLPEPVRC